LIKATKVLELGFLILVPRLCLGTVALEALPPLSGRSSENMGSQAEPGNQRAYALRNLFVMANGFEAFSAGLTDSAIPFRKSF
jgi:hypothetical protein